MSEEVATNNVAEEVVKEYIKAMKTGILLAFKKERKNMKVKENDIGGDKK